MGYGWGATSKHRLKIVDFAPTGSTWPKISARRDRTHQTFFFSRKTRLKWSFVWYKNLVRSFFRFVTIQAFDRRTEGQTDGELSHGSACSAVKINNLLPTAQLSNIGYWCNFKKNFSQQTLTVSNNCFISRYLVLHFFGFFPYLPWTSG